MVSGVLPCARAPRGVERAFRALVAGGVPLRPSGAARRRPGLLLRGYTPKHEIALFGVRFYLTSLREDANFRFFVAYVRLPYGRPALYPRLFYKDSSLVWRCATHYIDSENDNWIGKGDLKWVAEEGGFTLYSAEETTNLPLELQAALDLVSRKAARVRRDHRALGLVLRKAPDGRVAPYRDFSVPRRRAAKRHRQVHGGEPVAWFSKPCDPASLRIARGYAPDFDGGVIEVSESRSRLYGGKVRKFRILSANRRIQYQFLAAPRHVWIVPPQTLSTELSSYGVRTLDVEVAEELCVPGYEYHYPDDRGGPGAIYSQIPAGFAGAASDVDPSRADASPWLERLPVIREFRRKLGIGLALLAALVATPAAAPAHVLDPRPGPSYTTLCGTTGRSPDRQPASALGAPDRAPSTRRSTSGPAWGIFAVCGTPRARRSLWRGCRP